MNIEEDRAKTLARLKGADKAAERAGATVTAMRNHKDSLFRMVFNSRESLLSLCNAINGTQYTEPKDLKVVTLSNAIYMNFKNDSAFVIDLFLNLYEHQSTFNPNMPFRDLIYVTREYEKLISHDSLYASRLVKIPTPRFVVFYNGVAEQKERLILKLSDSFEKQMEEPELELKVTMLNINSGKNEELKKQCKLLHDYMIYVERVREYAKEMELSEAVERTVNECIKEGILVELLTKCRTEAIAVSIFEYDEEKELELYRRAERAVGEENGYKVGLEDGVEKGEVLFAKLTEKLIRDSRLDDLLKATNDKAFRVELYQEYDIYKD